MSPEKRAMKWLISRDTGASSEAIMQHMIGGVSSGAFPLDPSDLGRCLRLLKRVPEWRPRIGEMKKYGRIWKALVERWDDLETTMKKEVGIDWKKGGRAPQTYALMQSIMLQRRVAEYNARYREQRQTAKKRPEKPAKRARKKRAMETV
ncbi:hypothetical protein [Hyphomicrobium sp.]|uniref:hypothetical protein n=1 Tax=Hyphomicrobium sp. TaxID=82 RepID=UPI001D8695C4|nr:hypothetical protein [Hyphomicrobium sp.]MBY0561502.1 hypothetical protein [Hyphomicrobium sp.]